MWRDETDFLDLFMAYYNSHFESHETSKKKYRDFLMEIITAHEESRRYDDGGRALENAGDCHKLVVSIWLQIRH